MAKLTQVMALDNAINGILDDETIQVLKNIQKTLTKKNSSKGVSKTRLENEKSAQATLEMLQKCGKALSMKEIRERMTFPSSQKATAVVKILEEWNAVQVSVVKGDRYFKA